MKKFIKFMKYFSLVICAELIFLITFTLTKRINDIWIFTRRYNQNNPISIKKDFLISIDPDNNWIRVILDPNLVEFRVKGEIK